jgi:hypothetical protein
MGYSVSDAFPSDWLKAADLKGRERALVIKSADMQDIGQGADASRKLVIYFERQEKGLVLNKTNANTISAMYGDDTDDWIGGEIILFPTTADFQGRRVDAIRVKIPPRKPAARHALGPEESRGKDNSELDDEIPF